MKGNMEFVVITIDELCRSGEKRKLIRRKKGGKRAGRGRNFTLREGGREGAVRTCEERKLSWLGSAGSRELRQLGQTYLRKHASR